MLLISIAALQLVGKTGSHYIVFMVPVKVCPTSGS